MSYISTPNPVNLTNDKKFNIKYTSNTLLNQEHNYNLVKSSNIIKSINPSTLLYSVNGFNNILYMYFDISNNLNLIDFYGNIYQYNIAGNLINKSYLYFSGQISFIRYYKSHYYFLQNLDLTFPHIIKYDITNNTYITSTVSTQSFYIYNDIIYVLDNSSSISTYDLSFNLITSNFISNIGAPSCFTIANDTIYWKAGYYIYIININGTQSPRISFNYGSASAILYYNNYLYIIGGNPQGGGNQTNLYKINLNNNTTESSYNISSSASLLANDISGNIYISNYNIIIFYSGNMSRSIFINQSNTLTGISYNDIDNNNIYILTANTLIYQVNNNNLSLLYDFYNNYYYNTIKYDNKYIYTIQINQTDIYSGGIYVKFTTNLLRIDSSGNSTLYDLPISNLGQFALYFEIKHLFTVKNNNIYIINNDNSGNSTNQGTPYFYYGTINNTDLTLSYYILPDYYQPFDIQLNNDIIYIFSNDRNNNLYISTFNNNNINFNYRVFPLWYSYNLAINNNILYLYFNQDGRHITYFNIDNSNNQIRYNIPLIDNKNLFEPVSIIINNNNLYINYYESIYQISLYNLNFNDISSNLLSIGNNPLQLYYNNTLLDTLNINLINQNDECFLKGTLILTDIGYIPIENINLTNQIVTFGKTIFNKNREVKLAPIQRIINSQVKTNPVCIKKNALGNNYPFNDLYLSKNHSILFNNELIEINKLINDDTIFVSNIIDDYYHIELDDNYLIASENILTESYKKIYQENINRNLIKLK